MTMVMIKMTIPVAVMMLGKMFNSEPLDRDAAAAVGALSLENNLLPVAAAAVAVVVVSMLIIIGKTQVAWL